jgi:hypothetical protein
MDTNAQKQPDNNIPNGSSHASTNVTAATTTVSTTSILKVHLNDINLRHFRQKPENRRNIMNRPNLQIVLETIKEVKDINPKSMQSLNVRLDNCRLSLSLRDVLSLYSVILHQKQAVS